MCHNLMDGPTFSGNPKHNSPSRQEGPTREHKLDLFRFPIRRPLVLLGLAGGLVVLVGIVLAIALRHGTVVVEKVTLCKAA